MQGGGQRAGRSASGACGVPAGPRTRCGRIAHASRAARRGSGSCACGMYASVELNRDSSDSSILCVLLTCGFAAADRSSTRPKRFQFNTCGIWEGGTPPYPGARGSQTAAQLIGSRPVVVLPEPARKKAPPSPGALARLRCGRRRWSLWRCSLVRCLVVERLVDGDGHGHRGAHHRVVAHADEPHHLHVRRHARRARELGV